MPQPDSEQYKARKNHYQRMLTIYGRKPVLEALQNTAIGVHRLHLASSNRPAKILDEIVALAESRNIEISYKEKAALSRVSRNAKQDQGVAADLLLERMRTLSDFAREPLPFGYPRYLVLDRIHNPQNIGMIIRSAAAGGIDALFIPEQGNAAISALVIKASAGAIFKCPIVRCDTTEECILVLKAKKIRISMLSSHSPTSLQDAANQKGAIAYVLGNESDGVTQAVNALADERCAIPMHNGVESLNVAVTAALIAFMPKP
jgi:23S rRNA (guanosine2251-2'-O)-methyltransferase